jgi:uncharacterized protein
MIRSGELQKKAFAAKVRDTQIEKDYILTWILWGIATQPTLANALAFKGGTVLKKAYFEDYRFSEDLDFTVVAEITNDALLALMAGVFERILEEANIPLQIVDQGEHISGSIHFQIAYTGPLGGKGKQIKVDITCGEAMQYPTVWLPIFLGYSDLQDFKLQCYSLEEVIVEKMCAVIGRMQPRDLYDLWYLTDIHGVDVSDCQLEFERKARHKNYDPARFKTALEGKLLQYKARWQGSLVDQMQNLPDFDTAVRALKKHMRVIA